MVKSIMSFRIRLLSFVFYLVTCFTRSLTASANEDLRSLKKCPKRNVRFSIFYFRLKKSLSMSKLRSAQLYNAGENSRESES